MIKRLRNRFKKHIESQRKFALCKDIKNNITIIKKCKTIKGEPFVICLLKNGNHFIPSFLNHYTSIGFNNFIFLDNNSDDKSVELLKKHNVTILQSELPYSKYKWAFKQFLVYYCGEDVWTLYVDIDEFWEFPFQNKSNLKYFLEYLDRNNFNAVMSYMLDLFADLPLKDLENLKKNDLKDTFKYYDNTFLKIKPYTKAYNTTNHPDTSHFSGGIHAKSFGIDTIYLSKIPLIKWNKSISVHETSHTSTFINIADVSTVLLHYKFVSGFYKKMKSIIDDNNYWNGNEIYSKYLEVLKKNPTINLKTDSSKIYNNPEQLVEEKAMWISDKYISWISKKN